MPDVPIVALRLRSKWSISADRISREQIRIGALVYPERDYWRPRTRADCADVPRPCLYVACRFNLYLDVDPNGSIRFMYPRRTEPWDVPPHQSCALDVAERGGLTLEEVGSVLGLTRERVRQLEEAAFAKLLPEQHVEIEFVDRRWKFDDF